MIDVISKRCLINDARHCVRSPVNHRMFNFKKIEVSKSVMRCKKALLDYEVSKEVLLQIINIINCFEYSVRSFQGSMI